jgi:type VI secretion system protein ImpA
VDYLLRDISPDQPCGPAIESDNDMYALFLELERAAKSDPPRWDGMNEIPGRQADWADVEKRSCDILVGTDGISGSKDLRVAVYLARARLHLAGLVGLAEGLHLVRELLEARWESVHPLLRIEEGESDASDRTNALASLGAELVGEVQRTPMITVPVLGSVTWRDVEVAKSGAKSKGPSDIRTVTAAQIEGVFAECNKKGRESAREQLLSSWRGACAARDDLLAISALLKARDGLDGEQLLPLQHLLTSIAALLTEKVNGLGLVAEPVHGLEAASANDAATDRVDQASAPLMAEAISSRADVRLALRRICDYYDQHEPSSPLPILLNRALRLVDKSFVEIVKDLAPAGLAQIEQLRGTDSDEGTK